MRASSYVIVDNLEDKTQQWVSSIRAAVAPKPHLTVHPQQCALLVVDMLRYFTHPEGRCYLPASAAVIPQIRLLLSAWRKIGAPVVFTRHCHQGPNDLGMLGRFFSDHIRENEVDSQIIDELAPAPGELVLKKCTYDSFIGTNLQMLLEEEKISQVLVAGVLTHMCCETTARSAFCRGFEVYIPADGTATTSEERHLASLTNMADSVAVVLKTKEILEACDQHK